MSAFDSLDSLYKKNPPPIPHFPAKGPDMATVEIPGEEKKPEIKLETPIPEKKSPMKREYHPDNLALHTVLVEGMRSSFSYYDGFLADAIRYKDALPSQKIIAEWQSYVPQYAGMNHAQKDTYFWMRSELEGGNAIPLKQNTYLSLYCYEILNLTPEFIPSQKGFFMLSRLWKLYRKSFHILDETMPSLLAQYGLLYELNPRDFLSPEERGLLTHLCFRQSGRDVFAIYFMDLSQPETCASAFCRYISGYDYQKSRFYQKCDQKVMDRLMEKSATKLYQLCQNYNTLFSKATFTFLTFDGYIATTDHKKHIRVDYTHFRLSYGFSKLMTYAMRETENRLRSLYGVHPLTETPLTLGKEVAEQFDAWLDSVLPRGQKKFRQKNEGTKEEVADYEKLYDLPKKEVSFTDASAIEEKSWDITRALTEDLPEEREPAIPEVKEENKTTPSLAPFLASIPLGVEAQKKAAQDLKKPLSLLIQQVNDLAVDSYGDILLEEDGDGCRIIEDYRDEYERILHEQNQNL